MIKTLFPIMQKKKKKSVVFFAFLVWQEQGKDFGVYWETLF